MSSAGSTIRLSSGSSTPPAIDTSGGPKAAEAPLPDYRVQGHIISSQGQCTPTSDEDSWTVRVRCRDIAFWVESMKARRAYAFSRAGFAGDLALRLENLGTRHPTISTFIDVLVAALELRAVPQEQPEYCGVKTDQDHEPEQTNIGFPRTWRNIFRYRYDDLIAAFGIVEKMCIALDAMGTTVRCESQNEMPNGGAAMDWPQSQRRAIFCSLRGTVLMLRAGHSAWESAKDM